MLACRIGPFIDYIIKEIEKLGGDLYVNPDGHERKRSKWNSTIRSYWKLSEKLMVKHAHALICDSKNIEKYIQDEYIQYHIKFVGTVYNQELLKKIRESAYGYFHGHEVGGTNPCIKT